MKESLDDRNWKGVLNLQLHAQYCVHEEMIDNETSRIEKWVAPRNHFSTANVPLKTTNQQSNLPMRFRWKFIDSILFFYFEFLTKEMYYLPSLPFNKEIFMLLMAKFQSWETQMQTHHSNAPIQLFSSHLDKLDGNSRKALRLAKRLNNIHKRSVSLLMPDVRLLWSNFISRREALKNF